MMMRLEVWEVWRVQKVDARCHVPITEEWD